MECNGTVVCVCRHVCCDFVLTPLSGIFASLLPYAAPNNLRIVRLHLRDNAQSTRYSEEELKEINGKLAVQTVFMENRTRELAAFLQWFIEKEKIPPLHDADGKRTGGLALVAWSGGNAFCVPLFGSAGKLPSHQKEFLEGYLRAYVLYGASPCSSCRTHTLT